MSVHVHIWKARSDIGCAMYSCLVEGCDALGARSWATGRVVFQPFEREKPALTVQLKEQPRKQDYEPNGAARPRRVHRSEPLEVGIGRGRAFRPSPTYKRVCVAMLELGADRPLQTLAEMAGCSVAFVKKVQAHVMADDYVENA